MAYIIDGEDLKRLVRMNFEEMKRVLKGKINDIEYEESVDENGELICSIYVYDKTISMTSITCHKKGYNVHWGNSTTWDIKEEIQSIMGGE
ncbi:hypothetical protein BTJ45_02931 [Bacillus mycoides]|nr:hypothetical protein BTJ45_02931 [Bacillus mycoides]